MTDPKRRIRVVSAAIRREGRYLITQRQEHAVLPLMWEFPGGKVEEGESDDAALQREMFERLGLEVTVGEQISAAEQEYHDYIVELHLYSCSIGEGIPRAASVKDFRWVRAEDFGRFDFAPADEQSMSALLFGPN